MTVTPTAETATLSPLVAKRIRGLLGEAGKSQAWLARELGVSQMYVSDRIRVGGTTPIDLNDLQRIARILGVAVADLLPKEGTTLVTAYSTTPEPVAAPHAVDVRSPRSKRRSRFALAAATS